MIANDCNQM